MLGADQAPAVLFSFLSDFDVLVFSSIRSSSLSYLSFTVEFYRFISNGFDKPHYTLHYSVDAPLMIRSLLYVPSMNMEKYPGAPRTPLGVSLYCRKVSYHSKRGSKRADSPK